MFGSMREEERGPEVAATFPFRQWSGLDSKLKAGFAYRNKDRDSRWRRFAYKPPSLGNAVLDSLLAQDPERYLTDALIAGKTARRLRPHRSSRSRTPTAIGPTRT